MFSTWAKSLTLLSSLLAILGVPLHLEPISNAASSSISAPNILALLFIIFAKSFSVYSSNLCIIPNLSRSGEDKDPALVVAPTNVNLGRSSLIDFAAGPFPIIISKLKSSNAGYNISSTDLLSLCISSINNISPSCRFVSIAAKSPAFSIAGPDVI